MANPNTVIPTQPATATAGVPIPVGNNPGVLAASADGKYLYIAPNGDHAIQRINLQTNAVERTFALPVDSSFGALQVLDMHVAPSNDTEVVVSLMVPGVSPSEMGLALFNDAGLVNRTPGTKDSLSVDRFVFTSNPSTLYADTLFGSGFAEVGFGPAGVSFDGTYCCAPPDYHQFSLPALASDGTLLYTQNGLVWDPARSAGS